MSQLRSWSSILAAAWIGSTSGLAGAQGLRADTGLPSPWSFAVGGFAQDGGSTSWRTGRWLPPHWWATPTPRLGESFRTEHPGLSSGPDLGRPAVPAGATGLAGAARYALPIRGLQVFGGGGAGLYRAGKGFGLHEVVRGSDLGLHAVAGVSMSLADDAEVGVSLRRVWIQRDGAGGARGGGKGTVEEGGSFLFLGLRVSH